MKPFMLSSLVAFSFACSGGSGSSGDVGQAGGACYPNNTCNPGLSCVDSVCEGISPGSPGGACYPNNTCDVGSECLDGICEGPDGGGVVLVPDGGGGFSCNNDSEIEPNETRNQATDTGIPDFSLSVEFVGLAICPTQDVDLFQFDIAANGTDVRVEIEFDSTQGQLALDLDNGTGNFIPATSGGNPNVLTLEIDALPIGSYFARVSADGVGVQNNYSIEIVTTP